MNPDDLQLVIQLLPRQLWNTVYMVFTSSFLALLIGLPIGILLSITGRGQIKELPLISKILGVIINIGRSFPFAILMVALIPLTRWILGTSLGTTASIVPLTIGTIPFVARLAEASLKEVDKSLVEAAVIMGSNTWQIISKVLLPEALPSLISAMTLTVINLIGYSAMVGLIGGGGLGQVAIQYGYQRFNTPIMIITVALLILLIQAVQWTGGTLNHMLLKNRGKTSHG